VGTLVLPLDEGGARFSAGFTHDGAARFLSSGQELERSGWMLDITPHANAADIAARTGVDLSEQVQPAELGGLTAINAQRNRRSPEALVVVLGAMSLGVLVHLTLNTISRRRRDFDVLRALGYTSGQVRSTTAWLVTAVTGLGLVVAVPVGYVVGAGVWLDYAASLQVFPESRFPWVGILVLVPVVTVVANLAALAPNRRKTRARPSELLRDQ
jgi:putative ABC transport system permease protein